MSDEERANERDDSERRVDAGDTDDDADFDWSGDVDDIPPGEPESDAGVGPEADASRVDPHDRLADPAPADAGEDTTTVGASGTPDSADIDEPKSADDTPLSALRQRMEGRRRGARAGEREESTGAPVAGAPLSDLASEVQSRASSTPSESTSESLFEQVNVTDLDPEAVWEAVISEETAEPEPGVGASGEAEPVDEDEHIVNKREFCQQCEHFSDPPEATCGHEGTTIVELTDKDCFRVRNCPMVEEDDDGPDLTGR